MYILVSVENDIEKWKKTYRPPSSIDLSSPQGILKRYTYVWSYSEGASWLPKHMANKGRFLYAKGHKERVKSEHFSEVRSDLTAGSFRLTGVYDVYSYHFQVA